MNKLGDQRAFPVSELAGMTYRQWLVGMALQGILANSVTMHAVANNKPLEEVPVFLAVAALDIADCVIAQLEKHS